MQAFLLSVLKNLLVAAAFAFLSSLLYRPGRSEPPEPQDNDFRPTAREGTEIRQLFGTGPARLTIVAVMDRQVEAIKR